MHFTAVLYRAVVTPERNRANLKALEAATVHVHRLVQDIGPVTTRDLHAALHSPPSPSTPPLPPQAPANTPPPKDPLFRRNLARKRAKQSAQPEPTPQWSMAFLKRRVLAHLEAEGVLRKTTRERWARERGEEEALGEKDRTEFVWVARREPEEVAHGPAAERRKPGEGRTKVERELDRLKGDEGTFAPWAA
ncbi:hypothetical protein JCM10449v2_001597 [Rhodotorula kratochvilovae]